jgi:type II restriction/modification system DNA methylase subunit YeeA
VTYPSVMTPEGFAAKWQDSTATERAASQEHFIDLCRMLGVATPNEADPTGEWYAFEKGASKSAGGDGFADVWKKGLFAWEYKGKRKDLGAAYQQLLGYREALENPPLLVVCDLNRFEIRTNWTNTATKTYAFTLDDLAADPAEPLRILRAVMSDPEELRPTQGSNELTAEAASRFAHLAVSLGSRYDDPLRIAHFLDKLLFCLYAEDANVLPKGLVTRLIASAKTDPSTFRERLADLFSRMASGGWFGVDKVDWFNGGLFADAEALELTRPEIDTLDVVSRLNWSLIEPAIFGTLFERGLDPTKRTQLGAHYTDRVSIERLVEPVVMTPLRREFEAAVAATEALLAKGGPANRKKALAVHQAFLERLRAVRVLDPACGSGNFLYIALRKLKDLEREAIGWASQRFKIPLELFVQVGPQNVLGLELNPYAAELARVTIWIGEIQWMLNHGFAYRHDPVLRPLDQISIKDALLDFSDPSKPWEAVWPDAEFIVGNPPFLGGKMLRSNLGDAYVDALFEVYDGRVPREADFVAYWHEKARAMVAEGRAKRVGLLATQGIRGGANRRVIERIKESGDLFLAWSDEPWILDGAAVHISFLGYDNGSDTTRSLDGRPVAAINANLTAGLDLTIARRLKENLGIAFMGDTKSGPFDITAEQAARMLAAKNPDGRSNADVVRPWMNGIDVTGQPRNMWIIDFGVGMPEAEAALYEGPFEYVRWIVKPERENNKRAAYAERWWLHVEPRSGMRAALAGLPRYLATPNVTKHRLFAWLPPEVLADHQLIVFARDDDFTFGVLHSKVHELWARAMGTQLREVESGFRYTPTTTFETFPMPEGTEQMERVAEAARRLDSLRGKALGMVDEDNPKGRTLTSLYNKPPSWLRLAHRDLDDAVFAAYGWPTDLSNDEILTRLLEINLAREPA